MDKYNKSKIVKKMIDTDPTILIIILNVNALNTIQRHTVRVEERSHCLVENHFTCKNTHRLKVKGWKIYFMQTLVKNI